MALYFGSKKIAGNTTSEPLKNDVKNYTVTFDDSGTTENVNDIDSLLTKFKSKLSLSSLFNLIKTGFKMLNEKASTYVTKTMMSKTQVDDESKVPTSSLTYSMQKEITQNKNEAVKAVANSAGKEIGLWIGKLSDTQNYLQFRVDGTDKGYLVFDVSRNIE